MPLLFPVLWSTGFIGAKLGLPYAEPFTFLSLRFGLAALLLLPFALVAAAPWPRDWTALGHIAFAGVLVHAISLGGVFSSIHFGLPAGLVAMIMGFAALINRHPGRALAQ